MRIILLLGLFLSLQFLLLRKRGEYSILSDFDLL